MTTEHVENAPADGVNPQDVIEQNTNSPIPEGTGSEAATTNADSDQTRGTSPAETGTQETDARQPSRAQDRIQQLVDQRRRADEKREQAEAERDAALRQLQALKKTPPQPINETDYPDEASRLEAIAERVAQKAEQRAAERFAQQADERAFHARQQAYNTRVAEFRERAPDFDQVTRNPNLPITPVMAEAITDSNWGPQVGYWLGKNPSEAARIASLPPMRQVAEIGQIEARIGAAPQVRKTTGAPPPPKTISGVTTAPAEFNLESGSNADYRAARKAQDEAARAGR